MGNAGDLAPLIALNKSRNARSNDKVETFQKKLDGLCNCRVSSVAFLYRYALKMGLFPNSMEK